ncbi:MAG: MBL fold metallo-hydrolase [Planctomycetota bacterium]
MLDSTNSDPVAPIVRGVPLGDYQTNCYTIRSGEHIWIVDAGDRPGPLIDLVLEQEIRPDAVILTHAHPDHIAGLPSIRRAFPGVPVLIHEAERAWLSDPALNLSAFMGNPISLDPPDRLLTDGETLTLGTSRWEVRHVPGHSPGSIALISGDAPIAMVGDALFRESIGRTDFPGCSVEVLSISIRSHLYTLPDETAAYPGHGPPTTIGHEKRHNQFVRPEGEASA